VIFASGGYNRAAGCFLLLCILKPLKSERFHAIAAASKSLYQTGETSLFNMVWISHTKILGSRGSILGKNG
jgi:hypothetical protein